MGRNMGITGGLERDNLCFIKKNRWMMTVPGVVGENRNGSLTMLPPSKAARPNIAFKEMQVEHLTETIWYPTKPEYKPIQITVFDFKTDSEHPVFAWIRQCYDAKVGTWKLPANGQFMKDVRLEMYDGCGNVLETWVYENAWPQQSDFGDLDMASGEIVMCDITLRYARAYIV